MTHRMDSYRLCVKGRYGYDYVHHADRLLKPRLRTAAASNFH
jgi:predicted molibdopterin-dependent oxidoreductase YjgC